MVRPDLITTELPNVLCKHIYVLQQVNCSYLFPSCTEPSTQPCDSRKVREASAQVPRQNTTNTARLHMAIPPRSLLRRIQP